jgi:peptidoglycan LD-endopeptidase CwlK
MNPQHLTRDNSLNKLHSAFAVPLSELITALNVEKIPLRVYESVRTPFRQAQLYAKGRAPGNTASKVTNAPAWASAHQYGFAVDMVFDLSNNQAGHWAWDVPKDDARYTQIQKWWERYSVLIEQVGLVQLSFEKPHVQAYNDKYMRDNIYKGIIPPLGGDDWEKWLEEMVLAWGYAKRTEFALVNPAAPNINLDRPPLEG